MLSEHKALDVLTVLIGFLTPFIAVDCQPIYIRESNGWWVDVGLMLVFEPLGYDSE